MIRNRNIFQIWDSLGRVVPFKVTHSDYSEGSKARLYWIVRRIDCPKMPYGKAYGDFVLDGIVNPEGEYYTTKDGRIGTAGCYKWELI